MQIRKDMSVMMISCKSVVVFVLALVSEMMISCKSVAVFVLALVSEIFCLTIM